MRTILVALLLCCLAPVARCQQKTLPAVCLSVEERKLYDLINAYRKEKGLPAIPLSRSLTYVAQTHAKDVTDNPPAKGCNLHSWSAKGPWTTMCYTSDHAQAAKMWSKPVELTNYKSNGFEISYVSSGNATAQGALDGWKSSSGHNNVVINGTGWEKMTWKAIGIGIYKGNACVWFGTIADPDAAVPGTCK